MNTTEEHITDANKIGENMKKRPCKESAQPEHENKTWYLRGLRDGIPIGLGYFAVGFTLGIAAREAGITAFQMGLMSLLMHASAGQFAVITIIAGQSGYVAMILTQIVINIRYLLMSCSLSQKISPNTSNGKRMLLAYFVTDEIFGIAASVKGTLNPFYNYGAATVASPGWILGTALGVLVGNILPASMISALSVALYGMFLAVVIPAAKGDRVVAAVVIASMAGSCVFSWIPVLKGISGGTKIIILTVVIAAAAAIIRPVPPEKITGGAADTADTEGSTRAEEKTTGHPRNTEDGLQQKQKEQEEA